MIIIITLQQLYTFIITFTHSVQIGICNILKEVSSAQQGCIYLYSKKYMPDSRRGSQKWPKNIILVTFFYLLILS